MTLYRFLSRFLPASYLAKLFLVVFVGFAVPLAGLVLYSVGSGANVDRSLLGVLFAASCAGMVLVLLGLRAMLEPMLMVTGVLDRWGRTGQVQILPEDYKDEVGLLMVRTNRLMARAQRTLDQSRRESDTDPLTGALNRRGAERLLRDAPAGWILLMDLDQFRFVNDRNGMAEGDRILREVVQVCANILRQDDLFARFAGEEFLVFLPGAPRHVAGRVAERLRSEITQSVTVRGLMLTASIGLAAHPGGDSIDAALEIAEAELGRAKDLGCDRICGAEDGGQRAA
ncbi:GGDEF domain-containing protein [Roseisalinus antarcticus]|uniref:diguanylate cyclase n=1 Tax=Roseisalinus antarcticus TaxID=254357 RepID=A0A1Y5TTL7_9RHOB|nr:GGDEF domain-containing protein [Roseisalinus antarcticus]SLN72241.1 putative diguanylate cyclase YdaM [Roseisalinus antarcticus]